VDAEVMSADPASVGARFLLLEAGKAQATLSSPACQAGAGLM
jgi:hypothetical protein